MTKSRIVHDGVLQVSRIGKAVDHPLRIRALAALRGRELCVCELIELFGLSPSTVSKHMSIVADAGLVERRRDGRWTYYALASQPSEPLAHALAMVMSLVEDDPVILEDRVRIQGITCDAGE